MSTSKCDNMPGTDDEALMIMADHDTGEATRTNEDRLELADEFTAVLVIAIANKLTRGASKFYRTNWNIGVVEFRILMCLRPGVGRAIGDIAEAADVDKGAVSRAVKVLVDMNLVETAAAARRRRSATPRSRGGRPRRARRGSYPPTP